jgi:hypothetical protein
MKLNFLKNKKKDEEVEKKFPEENIDYKLLDNVGNDVEVTPIQILKGEFERVTYCYGKIKVIHEETPPKLEFDYYIIEPGNLSFEELKNSEKFSIIMGDILVSIFDKNLLKNEMNTDESIRADYPEKFDL